MSTPIKAEAVAKALESGADGGAAAEDDSLPPCPLVGASLMSSLTLGWLTPLVDLAYKKDLGADDIWRLPPGDSVDECVRVFRVAWHAEQQHAAEAAAAAAAASAEAAPVAAAAAADAEAAQVAAAASADAEATVAAAEDVGGRIRAARHHWPRRLREGSARTA